jgi:hypothetical protein
MNLDKLLKFNNINPVMKDIAHNDYILTQTEVKIKTIEEIIEKFKISQNEAEAIVNLLQEAINITALKT